MAVPRVVVIGGGITGLATAFYLQRAAAGGARPRWEVVVLEAARQAGGKLRTEQGAGFLVEAGPDSFLTSKPAAVELCRELGLEPALIPQQPPRGAYVLRRGRLVPIPAGMRLVHPTRPWPFLRSPLLSLPGRLRALLHPLTGRPQTAGDESVGSFVQRRYGAEMLRVLGEPLLAGIHLADPWQLSLAATFPALRAGAGKAPAPSPAPPPAPLPLHLRGSPFASLAGGMDELVGKLCACLGDALRTAAPVAEVAGAGGGYRIRLRSQPDPLAAAAVVITTPAAAAGRIVTRLNPRLAGLLSRSDTVSSAVVTLGFADTGAGSVAGRRGLRGSGFVVPRGEGSELLACTWSSSKWAGRAPAGGLLVRAFLGGWRHPELLQRDDAHLIGLVQRELATIMGAALPAAPPAVTAVHRWPAATPVYRVGHRDWVAQVNAAAAATPGLWLAGAPYDGVGIPDCVRQARQTAAAVAAFLSA